MTFSVKELSVDGATPVVLYQVVYSGRSWYYTSADTDIVFSGKTYFSVPCSHAEIEQQLSGDKFNLPVTFPHDIPFGEIFRVQPPSEIVSMTILVKNSDEADEYVVLWKGRIVNLDWKYPWVELITESIASSMKRVGLRRRYSVPCTHPLYSAKCGVVRTDYRTSGVVVGIDGLDVTVVAAINLIDNFYAGGIAIWGNNISPNIERRMIFASNGTTGVLTLTNSPVGLTVGQAIDIYPGCDHSISTCSGKFNNSDNYGGMPYIPLTNPFAGTTLY